MDLFKIPGVLRLIFSALPGRVAYAMITLATFFYVKDATGSITVAGLATGFETVASSLTAGLRGSLIDRYGQFKPFSIYVPAWTLTVLLLSQAGSTPEILFASALVGLSSPPINLAARPLWRDAVGANNLRTAYAIDTTILNITSVTGPVIVTYLAISHSGSFALWCTAGLMAIGGTLMLTMPLSRNWKPEPKETSAAGLWRNRSFQVIVIEGMVFGLSWGMLEITLPAYSTLINKPGLSAPLLATLAAASIFGGIVIGGRKSSITPLRGFKVAGLLAAIASWPLVLTKPGISMGIVLAAVGFAIGFAQVYHWETLEAVRPAGTATSAQAWLWTVEGSMLAVGAALGGFLVEQVDPRYALAIVSIGLSMATTFIWTIGARHLKGADRPLSEVQKVAALADLETPAE